jgi:hypothetical protein
LPAVVETAGPGDLWIADRNFCTRDFLAGLVRQGAFFVIREHQSFPVERVGPLGAERAVETGSVAEQRVRLFLTEPTRDGATRGYVDQPPARCRLGVRGGGALPQALDAGDRLPAPGSVLAF